jgi:hypothetical protein
VGKFTQRLLHAIGREKVEIKRPSATEPRAGYISYTMRLLLGDEQAPKRPDRREGDDGDGKAPKR